MQSSYSKTVTSHAKSNTNHCRLSFNFSEISRPSPSCEHFMNGVSTYYHRSTSHVINTSFVLLHDGSWHSFFSVDGSDSES